MIDNSENQLKTEVAIPEVSRTETSNWHGTDWNYVNKKVFNLQKQIAKAEREGRGGKVRRLQNLLTRSIAAKKLAVKRVTENQGAKTPGVDGETWNTPKAKALAVETLKEEGYKPKPLKRVFIPKPNGKERPLGIPTMKDRAMQVLHKLALEPVAENNADPNSYGFRPYRSTADAMQQAYLRLGMKISPQWILEGDIKGCFDNIDHEWLIANVSMSPKVLRRWLKAGTLYQGIYTDTIAGTPQGGVISPVLANIALDGLEAAIRAIGKYNVVRYADDFIVTGYSKEELETVKPIIEDFMRARGLMLSPEKTKITHINDGFDFLGWNFRKYDGKLLIKPSKANIQSFMKEIKKAIKDMATTKQEDVIDALNPKIRGWANYHKGTVAKEAFSQVDHEIWKTLWNWCKRRHPNKPESWIQSRYWIRKDGRNWVFSSGKRRLIKTKDTKIIRHIKTPNALNPFILTDRKELEELRKRRTKRILFGTVKELWERQEGNCPNCHQGITEESEWHKHHIQPKSQGGSDELDNLILVCSACHSQIHNPIYRDKTGPRKGLIKA
jgi:RNA-directed DNA polymerase